MATALEHAQNDALDALDRLIEAQVAISPEMRPVLAERLARMAEQLGGRRVSVAAPAPAPQPDPAAQFPFAHPLDMEPVRLALDDLSRRALRRDDRAIVERAQAIDAAIRAWMTARLTTPETTRTTAQPTQKKRSA